jgi:RIO kinase 1
MNTDDYLQLYDQLDDEEQTDNYLDRARRRRPSGRHPKKLDGRTHKFVQTQDDSRANFQFTYKAARFEESWLLDSLGDFYEHQWIADVLRRVKGGKEASVYQCRGGTATKAKYVAAKVYRPREMRNLRNDHLYREGRDDLDDEGKQILDGGMLHAMQKKTGYGRKLLHQSWIAYEFTALQDLYAAGADVPRPYTMENNAILMDYIGGDEAPAPALNEISLESGEAKILFERVLYNLELMLANGRIHGDLSAYNVLYWEGEITLIDFPQVIAPRENNNAYLIFRRDVTRVCEYFMRQGLQLEPRALADELWTAHGYRTRQEVHPQNLDADDPQDRQLWQKQQKEK